MVILASGNLIESYKSPDQRRLAKPPIPRKLLVIPNADPSSVSTSPKCFPASGVTCHVVPSRRFARNSIVELLRGICFRGDLFWLGIANWTAPKKSECHITSQPEQWECHPKKG